MIIVWEKKYKDILVGSRTYFAAISLFRSRLLSRATKIILHKTLIRPVVSYGAEAWVLTKREEQAVLIFERKIFRRIYGPKYENGEWKSRTNRELEEMSKGENIVKWIKGQRISWLGHLERMDAQKDLHSRTGRYEVKGKTQERMEKGSRKRSSSAGSEKIEKVGDRKKWKAKAHRRKRRRRRRRSRRRRRRRQRRRRRRRRRWYGTVNIQKIQHS